MSFGRALRAETLKLVTVRSNIWAIVAVAVAAVAYTVLLAPGVVDAILENSDQLAEGVTALNVGLEDLMLWAVLPVIVGALVGAGEYIGGQLSTSVLAVPHRGSLFAAKLLVTSVVCTVMAALYAVVVALSYQGGLGDQSVVATGQANEYITRSALGVLYWACLGLMSVSVAVLIRSQAISLTVLVLLAFAGMALLMISDVFQYLPVIAGTVMFIPEQSMGLAHQTTLDRPDAIAITLAWTVGVCLAGALVFGRRDVGGHSARLG